ncbi:hypothetical protein DL93DRAFT_2099915 [Clavulina sp. PMI_390]|nr:hypothetical protein DL93DRAFT_2099915 [Clavulina sp. PMI_390]
MERVTLTIIADHAEIKDYYEKYLASTGEEKAKLFDLFRWKLASHTVSEELMLHPAFANAGLEGALKDSEAHNLVKAELIKLDSMDATSGETIMKELYSSLLPHFAEEENVDLPELESKLSDTESNALFVRFDSGRAMFARDAANPPAERPFSKTADLFATPHDKLREMAAIHHGTAMK